MIIIIITHCTSITTSSTTTIEANIAVLIHALVAVAMVTSVESCAVVGVRYVVVMVTAVLVSLSVEAVFNIPVILIVVGATVSENSGEKFSPCGVMVNTDHCSSGEIHCYFVFGYCCDSHLPYSVF